VRAALAPPASGSSNPRLEPALHRNALHRKP
jgi:hypothetical protein